MVRAPTSVLSRPGAEPDVVIAYGPEVDHVVDVFLPPGPPTPAPVVVALHGGFWQQEWDRHHLRPLATALRDLGFVVATPEYARVGGRGGWPTTFDDVSTCLSALPGLLDTIVPGRTDNQTPTVIGHSAGGHLALWWALTAQHPPDRVVALAPVADLARAFAENLGSGAVASLLGGGPDDCPDRYAFADPAPMLERALGTDLIVIHGADDEQVPVQHSRDLPGVALIELADTEHFGLIDPRAAAWPALVSTLARPR